MPEPLRFGLLSFAHYHANFWAEAAREDAHARLSGIWDDNLERGKAAAEKFQTPFYPDLQMMLKNCDAVGITSETCHHAGLVEAAAAAGKHILLEKPMACTLEECARIQTAVQKAGIVFMQNFPKRYDPINLELVNLVHSGQVGKPLLVRIRHGNYHLLDKKDDGLQWFSYPRLAGGGALIDEGIHAADFLLWLLGMPVEVTAMTSNAAVHIPVEDTAVAVFRYQDGAMAEIVTSNAFLAASESIEIYGNAGAAILSGVDLASRDFTNTPFLKIYKSDMPRGKWLTPSTIPQFKIGHFHHQGPLHFFDCVRGNKIPVVSLEEGLKSLSMIFAAYRAAQSGKSQKIESIS